MQITPKVKMSKKHFENYWGNIVLDSLLGAAIREIKTCVCGSILVC